MSAIMSKVVEAHIDSCVKVCARRGTGDQVLGGLKKAFTTALRQVQIKVKEAES